MKTALTIAGSDCSGGAGIQADIKTMSALGVYGMSVIVSVVAENTSRVISIEDVSPKMIADQLDAIFEDIEVDAVKVGMLTSPMCMVTVANKLKQYSPKHIVVDPVMYATGGSPLMQEDAIDIFISEIIPLATMLTPNIPEAERIVGKKIVTVEDMKNAAAEIQKLGAKTVLIKGGHYDGDALDILFDRENYHTYIHKRINSKNTHGTGCTLSSAIASYLALGLSPEAAVKNAKEYITGAIESGLNIGKGHGPTHHFHKFYSGN
ncbi:MAG: bifunctional hydroxymethylpyrimidine kinase/phosphomethylpyrimidine kinase [Clostridiales bacterium]|nr:bifunctional hydroxymethylpyrimidine kinase/phosphomethylpyrimidine kinase [Clostridiales bacterium]